jgi:hypothetical protein
MGITKVNQKNVGRIAERIVANELEYLLSGIDQFCF